MCFKRGHDVSFELNQHKCHCDCHSLLLLFCEELLSVIYTVYTFLLIVTIFQTKLTLSKGFLNKLKLPSYLGLAGLVAVCGIGIYKYKHRGGMSTSVFLMQLRVAAQGTVVGALSIGLAYTMAQKYLFKHDETPVPPAAATNEQHGGKQ